MNKNFVSTDGKGFQMTFSNGLTASVQWGRGNYCDNHIREERSMLCNGAQCNTAEVAVWKGETWLDANDFVPEECGSMDTVCGYMKPDQVVDFLYAVKNADSSKF